MTNAQMKTGIKVKIINTSYSDAPDMILDKIGIFEGEIENDCSTIRDDAFHNDDEDNITEDILYCIRFPSEIGVYCFFARQLELVVKQKTEIKSEVEWLDRIRDNMREG